VSGGTAGRRACARCPRTGRRKLDEVDPVDVAVAIAARHARPQRRSPAPTTSCATARSPGRHAVVIWTSCPRRDGTAAGAAAWVGPASASRGSSPRAVAEVVGEKRPPPGEEPLAAGATFDQLEGSIGLVHLSRSWPGSPARRCRQRARTCQVRHPVPDGGAGPAAAPRLDCRRSQERRARALRRGPRARASRPRDG
jgi:hypothetical protein